MRKLIRTDGTEVDLPDPLSMSKYHDLIDAKTLDSVLMRHMGRPIHVMLVDDAGHITEAVESTDPDSRHRTALRSVGHNKPVNLEATRLYHLNCRPGTTHQIVGDVVIVPDEDFA